ncbi:hypothetical protein Ait01nite_087870 [Actinoplanes italicus]|nr:hypothetical protein Ait01nite_087870 [Actinoplanes italicus]
MSRVDVVHQQRAAEPFPHGVALQDSPTQRSRDISYITHGKRHAENGSAWPIDSGGLRICIECCPAVTAGTSVRWSASPAALGYGASHVV